MTAAAGLPPRAARGEPGSIRAVALAIAVHAAFFALIVFGVSWQVRPTAPVQVELWDKLPSKPSPPVEVPPPIEAKLEPPAPVDLKPPPPIEKPVEAKPRPDAEIAEKLERQKREKEKREREKQERLEKQKAAEAKKREEDETRRKAEAEKKKREDEKRRREEEAARREAEKAREAALAAQRAEFDRYVDQIRAKIRGRANVPDTVRGNPAVEVLIRVLPGGEVLDITVTKRSGNPAYDSAIERGIRSASPLPVPPANSELFPQFRELKLLIHHER